MPQKWAKNTDDRITHIEEYLSNVQEKINKTADDYENMSFLVGVVRHNQKQMQEMNNMLMQQNMFTQKVQEFMKSEGMDEKFNDFMKAQMEAMKKKDEPETPLEDDSPEDEPPAPEEESE